MCFPNFLLWWEKWLISFSRLVCVLTDPPLFVQRCLLTGFDCCTCLSELHLHMVESGLLVCWPILRLLTSFDFGFVCLLMLVCWPILQLCLSTNCLFDYGICVFVERVTSSYGWKNGLLVCWPIQCYFVCPMVETDLLTQCIWCWLNCHQEQSDFDFEVLSTYCKSFTCRLLQGFHRFRKLSLVFVNQFICFVFQTDLLSVDSLASFDIISQAFFAFPTYCLLAFVCKVLSSVYNTLFAKYCLANRPAEGFFALLLALPGVLAPWPKRLFQKRRIYQIYLFVKLIFFVLNKWLIDWQNRLFQKQLFGCVGLKLTVNCLWEFCSCQKLCPFW